MQKNRTKIISVLATVLAMMTLIAAPVAAKDGTTSSTGSGDASGATNMTTSTSHSGDSPPTAGGTMTTTAEAEAETAGANTTDVHNKVEALRLEGMNLLTTERKTEPTHTLVDRQKSCAAHQDEINTKITNFSSSAQTRLDVFNKIFVRVQAFQTSKHLTVSNYDALVVTATSKQTNAVDTVAALKTLSVKVDCTSQDPAAAISSVKSAVDTTRTALQAYRSAIKDIVTALHTALDKQTTTTTGGAQ